MYFSFNFFLFIIYLFYKSIEIVGIVESSKVKSEVKFEYNFFLYYLVKINLLIHFRH